MFHKKSGPPKKQKLSLIIPAYNEEEKITATLREYHSFLSKAFPDSELIVVSNNCSDSTPGLAKEFASLNKNVIALDLPYYAGKGGAVAKGFEMARGTVVGFVDADNSTAPPEFLGLAREMEKGFDVVIGSRAVHDSVLAKPQPLSRRLLGKAFSVITNFLFGLGVTDTQCGAKVFSRKAVDELLKHEIRKGFEFDVQLLWIAKKSGFRIKEKGIVWRNSEGSKVGFLDPFKMLVGLLSLRLKGK